MSGDSEQDSDEWRKETVWLEITHYAYMRRRNGIMHYYGKFYLSDFNSARVLRILTAEEAHKINVLDGSDELSLAAYKKGDEYNGFDSYDELVKHAVKTYRTLFPIAKRLVIGNPVYDRHDGLLHKAEPPQAKEMVKNENSVP